MKFKINAILIAVLAIIAPIQAQAQKETTHALEWSILHGLEYEIYAGVNIGGTAPIPLPSEIRKINGYNPYLNLPLRGHITKWNDHAPK